MTLSQAKDIYQQTKAEVMVGVAAPTRFHNYASCTKYEDILQGIKKQYEGPLQMK